MAASARQSIQANFRPGMRARVIAWAATLIFTALSPGPLWAQTNWLFGTNIISSPAGTNVGIGTTSPGATLDVSGSIRATGWLVPSSGVGLELAYNPGANSSTVSSYDRSGAAYKDLIINALNHRFYIAAVEKMRIDSSGNVGIGTTAPQYRLAVNGTIGTKEVVVTSSGWADYVFKPDYRLPALAEVSAFIQGHHHLSEIPSEKEVQEKGARLGEMQAKLLAKVEELTLYVIQEHERNDRLALQNQELQQRLAQLESRVGDTRVK